MSVTFQSMVVYGWNIGTEQYEEYDEEDGWENTLDQEYGWRDASEGDVVCVYDGRSGRYCYFGIIVAATNSTRGGPQDFENHYTLSESPPSEQMFELGQEQASLGLTIEEDPQYHIFTHVT